MCVYESFISFLYILVNSCCENITEDSGLYEKYTFLSAASQMGNVLLS